MKTSGFREIDFSKTECKNCGIYCKPFSCYVEYYPPVPTGNIITYYNAEIREFPLFPPRYEVRVRIEDCPVCKGTGFIDESVTTELELE